MHEVQILSMQILLNLTGCYVCHLTKTISTCMFHLYYTISHQLMGSMGVKWPLLPALDAQACKNKHREQCLYQYNR